MKKQTIEQEHPVTWEGLLSVLCISAILFLGALGIWKAFELVLPDMSYFEWECNEKESVVDGTPILYCEEIGEKTPRVKVFVVETDV